MDNERYILNEYITKEKFMFRNSKKSSEFLLEWEEIESRRKDMSIEIPLNDAAGSKLRYVHTLETDENIKNIMSLGQEDVTDMISSEVKSDTLVDSLIDEAFSSSVIEGAYSTRKRAGDMIKNNLNPQNKSEKMIFNNYKALVYTMENIEKEFSHDFIYRIWQILTEGTIDEEDITELYRTDRVFVEKNNEIIYEGPDHKMIYDMMDNLVSFMNMSSIMNPIINACVIHYYFVYIHPFFDGNGRTARAIMNIYLLKNGYEFFKYFSISKILVEKRKRYYSVIKECEDYGSDITYFIDFYSKLILETVNEVRKNYIFHYSKTIIENLLEKKEIFLNERQNRIIKSSLKSMNKHFDLKYYQKKYKITYETARKDMALIVELGIYKKIKTGKKFIYKMEKLVDIVEQLNRF